MKKTNNASLALFFSTVMACSKIDTKLDIATGYVYDMTDTLKSKPNPTNVLRLYGFEADPDETIEFRMVPITDYKLVGCSYYRLSSSTESKAFGNHDPHYRENNIRRFCTSVTKSFEEYDSAFDAKGAQTNSECYSSICDQLTWLASLKAERKYLFIYSNLCENNSEYSCFTQKGFETLTKNPTKVWETISKQKALPANLAGCEVVFIFTPSTQMEELLFMAFYELYHDELTKRGARVSFCASDAELKGKYERL